MKIAKRLFAVLLAAMMVMAMTVPAMAAGDTGSITIKDAVAGTTYKVYRIFDLDSYRAPAAGDTTDKGAYLYKVNDAWKGFMSADGISSYVTADNATGYVTWVGDKSDASVAAFAQKALAYAKENNISAVGSAKTVGEGETQVKFTGLELGYYLVDSSMGALCALTTTDPTAEITEKNEEPTIEKEITGSQAAGIGDTVNYQVTITVEKGAENYVLTDKMSAGLTFDVNSIKVQVDNTDVGAENYQTFTTATDDYTFKITFDDTYIANLAADADADAEIVITYSAKINENAETTTVGNTATLKYGDESSTTHTTSSSTEPKMVNLTIIKVDGATVKETGGTVEVDANTVYLGGAKFKLYKDTDDGAKYATFGNDNKLTGWVESADNATELTTVSQGEDKGKITVKGLAAGTYYLTETQAPDGYNKLEEDTTVTITVDDEGNIAGGIIYVQNNAGAVLPSTGGIGTTIFYAVGGFLVIAAAVILITRKRMNEE